MLRMLHGVFGKVTFARDFCDKTHLLCFYHHRSEHPWLETTRKMTFLLAAPLLTLKKPLKEFPKVTVGLATIWFRRGLGKGFTRTGTFSDPYLIFCLMYPIFRHYAHLKSDSGQTPKGFNSQDDILRAWRFICYESHKHKGSEAHHFVNPFPRASIRPTNTTSDVSYTQGHRHPDDMTDDELAYHLGKAVLISKAQKPASSFIFSNPFLQSSPAPTQTKSRPNSPKKMTPSKAPSSSSSSSSNKGKPHVSTGSPAKNCGKVIGDPFTTMGTTAPVLDYVVRSRSTTRMYTSK